MLNKFKLWKLKSAVHDRRNLQDALSAVMELGRMAQPGAVDILVKALERRDGVSRSAARELGKSNDPRASQALAAALDWDETNQAAAEALVKLGCGAVDVILPKLRAESGSARRWAATALGEIGDRRAVEPLIEVLGHDDEYEVRTAAATALGQLKDQRALWVLVGTLKLRGETDPVRQKALETLQQAAELARRKIGDPLAGKSGASSTSSLPDTGDDAEPAFEEPATHPRLLGDLTYHSETDLIGVMQDLMKASEEISWAKLENREPLLPAYFRSYEQRLQAAECVGQELMRRGGTELLRQILKRDLQNHETIKNWWNGLVR